MKMSILSRVEQEEDILEEQLGRGEISNSEYENALQDLHREARAMLDEEAERFREEQGY